MLESNTEAKQATGTSSKLGQAGRGQAKGSEVPSCLSRLTCHSMRHAPEPQSPFQELGTVVQVRRGWTVRPEQGPGPTPPHSPSLLNKTVYHLLCAQVGEPETRILCRR